MGYIEDMAAKEAARQDVARAKQAEAARVLDQGQAGLARTVADPYVNGMSQEDMYKLALAKQAQDANTYKAAMDMIAKNRDYNQAKQAVDNAPVRYETVEDPTTFSYSTNEVRDVNPADLATVRKYQQSIDPGLAAKWMADREAFK